MSRPSSRAGYPFVEGSDWYGRRMMYPQDAMDASLSMSFSGYYPYPMQTPYTQAPVAQPFCKQTSYVISCLPWGAKSFSRMTLSRLYFPYQQSYLSDKISPRKGAYLKMFILKLF